MIQNIQIMSAPREIMDRVPDEHRQTAMRAPLAFYYCV